MQSLSGSAAGPMASELPPDSYWDELQPQLPDLAAAAPAGLQRFSCPADPANGRQLARVLAALHRDGAVVVEGAVSSGCCDAVLLHTAAIICCTRARGLLRSRLSQASRGTPQTT